MARQAVTLMLPSKHESRRIHTSKDGKELIILFGGGTKKKQNTDIKEAKRLHEEYKTRKSAKLKIEKGNSKSDENKNDRGKS